MVGGNNLFIYGPNSTAWVDPLGLATYVIIGEGQAAIEAYAEDMRKKSPCDNFLTIKKDWAGIDKEARKNANVGPKDSGKSWEQKAVAGNAKWIRQQVDQGHLFIDIGTDSASNRSPFYAAEKKVLSRTKAKVLRPNRCAADGARKKSPVSKRPKAKGRY